MHVVGLRQPGASNQETFCCDAATVPTVSHSGGGAGGRQPQGLGTVNIYFELLLGELLKCGVFNLFHTQMLLHFGRFG